MIRVSLIIIINKRGEILLQHRDAQAPTNPNKWGLWGGSIEQNEEPLEAALRELKEELSVTVAPNELVLFKAYNEKNFNGQDVWEGHVFILQDNGNYIFVLGEGNGLQYFSKDEVIKMSDTDPVVQKIIPDYLASLHS